GLGATAGDATVTLTWSAPSSNGGSPITNYRSYRGTSSNGETLLATIGNVLTYSDTSVTNGVTDYYQVFALNRVGEGPRSNEASASGLWHQRHTRVSQPPDWVVRHVHDCADELERIRGNDRVEHIDRLLRSLPHISDREPQPDVGHLDLRRHGRVDPDGRYVGPDDAGHIYDNNHRDVGLDHAHGDRDGPSDPVIRDTASATVRSEKPPGRIELPTCRLQGGCSTDCAMV